MESFGGGDEDRPESSCAIHDSMAIDKPDRGKGGGLNRWQPIESQDSCIPRKSMEFNPLPFSLGARSGVGKTC